MAQAFNLTAQLNLRGPTNVAQIAAGIRKQLGSINANINFKLDPAAIKNTTALNSALKNLNSSFSATAQSATSATAAIKSFASSINSINVKNMPQQLNASASAVIKLNQAASKSSQTLASAHTEMQEFGKQAGLAVRRFAAFTAVTSIIYSVTNSISQGVQAFIDYDKELVRLQQVTGESAQGLGQLQKQISNLSTSFGVSSKDLTTVALTLAQAGLSAKDTERSLKALALSSLAPSFDNMNETVEGSIALMKQFGISAGDLESALGSINSVAAKFAVESADIITAIQRTGSVFATASKGVSEGKDALNEFIAVFTSVRATTRESAETIATGLRTIFTRIQRGSTIDALKEFGVNLSDAEGKFVGAYKAVELLSQGLNKIDPRSLDFSRIVEELGGFRQIGKVIPLIQQFGTAQEALKVAQKGQGSLAKDAATAQLSLANQIAKVREEFFALFREIGQSRGFQTVIKGALDLASAFIKIADSVKGILPVLAVLTAFRGASALTQFAGGFFGAVRGQKKYDGGIIRKFARGGLVPGDGGGDTVPALLEGGEVVMNRKAVQKYGASNLLKMNRHASGGPVEKYSASRPLVKNIDSTFDKEPGIPITSAIKKTPRLVLNKKDTLGVDIERIGWSGQQLAKANPNSPSSKIYLNTKNDRQRGLQFENLLLESNKIAVKGGGSSRLDGITPGGAFVEIKSTKNTSDQELLEKAAGAIFSPVTDNVDKVAMKKASQQALSSKPDAIGFGKLYEYYDTDIRRKAMGGLIQQFKIGGRALGARNKFKELTSEEMSQLNTKDLIKYGKRLARNIFTTGGAGMAVGSEFIEVPQKNIIPELESSLVTYMGKKGFWKEQVSPFGKPSQQIQKIDKKSGRQSALDKQIAQHADEVAAREQQWTKIRSGSSIDKYLQSVLQDPILSDYRTARSGEPLSKTFHNTRLRQAVNKALEKYDDFDYSSNNIDKLVSGMANKRFASGGSIQKFMSGGIAESILGKVPTLSELVSGPFAANKQFGPGEKSWKQILTEVLASQGIPYDATSGAIKLDTSQGLVAVSLKDAISPQQLKAAKFSSKVGATNITKLTKLRDLIQTRYVEGRGSIIESTRPRTEQEAAAAQAQDLMFGAVGLLGKEYDRMPLRISKNIIDPVDVVVSGRRLDPTVAQSIDKGFSKTLDKTSKRAARKVMIGQIIKDITGGNQLVLDFDRTLALGADKILSDPKNPKFAEFSDRTKVAQALQKARLSNLGKSLVGLINGSEPSVKSSLLARMSVLTARPQNTLDLIQTWLSSKGLPISKFTGVGGIGVTQEQISQLKASLIPSGASFVDDDKRNVEEAEQKGIKSYLYKFGKKRESSDIASAKGILFQDMVERLGAPPRNPNKQSMDFPFGIGAAAKYFDGLPPNIPTDAKRTISSASDLTENITNYLIGMGRATKVPKKEKTKKSLGGLIQKFAFGGKAEGLDFETVKKQILAKYPQIDFRISKRKSGFGYMIQAGLSPDQRSQVNFASNLNDLSIVSDKIAQDILHNYGPHIDSGLLKKLQKQKKFAIGGMSDTNTVLAKVSDGEAFVPPHIARQVGYANLDRMNQADRNGMGKFAAGSPGGISIFSGPGTGTSDSIGPIRLPVGSYILREKATKALGLKNGGLASFARGGDIQRFETGGIPVRPDIISSSTIKIDSTAETALKALMLVIDQLGLKGAATAQLLKNANNVSYKMAEKAAQADLDRAKAAGASIDQIMAAETALDDIRTAKNKDVGNRNILESAFSGTGRSSGEVQQEIIGKANSDADKKIKSREATRRNNLEKDLLSKRRLEAKQKIQADLEAETITKNKGNPLTTAQKSQINSEAIKRAKAQVKSLSQEDQDTVQNLSRLTTEQKQKIYDRSTLRATAQVTGVSKSSLDQSGIQGNDIRKYAQESMMDHKALAAMDKQYRVMREQELIATGKSVSQAKKLIDQELQTRRQMANDMAKARGISGPGSAEGLRGAFGGRVGKAMDYVGGTIDNIRNRGVIGNVRAFGQGLNSNAGFFGSMALGMLAGQGETFFGKKDASITNASKVAGFEQATSTLGTGLATASSLAMIPGVGPFAAVLTLGVTAITAWTSGVKAAEEAANEFTRNLQNKKADEASDALSRALNELAKDADNVKLQERVSKALQTSLTTRNTSVLGDVKKREREVIDREMSKRDWRLDPKAYGKPQLSIEDYRDLANTSAPKYEAEVQAAMTEVERAIKSGASIEDLATGDQFAANREVLARSNPETLAKLLMFQNEEAKARAQGNIVLADNYKLGQQNIIIESMRNNVAVQAAEKTIKLAQAMEEAERAGRKLAESYHRLFESVNQSIGRTAYESNERRKNNKSRTDALGGVSEASELQLRDLNILENRKSYTEEEYNSAISNAASLAPGDAGTRLKEASALEAKLGDSINMSIGDALQKKSGLSLGDAAQKAREAAFAQVDQMNVSDELKQNIKNQIETKFNSIQEKISQDGGTEQQQVYKFAEEVSQSGNVIGEMGKGATETLKALLKFRQDTINILIPAINDSAKAARESASFFRKARNIRSEGDRTKTEILTGRVEGYDETKNRVLAEVGQLTGGLTDPAAIRQKIEDMRAQASDQRAKFENVAYDPNSSEDDKQRAAEEFRNFNTSLSDAKEALDVLADSSELLEKAQNDLRSATELQKNREQFVNQLLTNTPEEADKLNQSFIRLQRNLSGGLNGANNQRDARKAFNDTLRQTGNVRLAARAGNAALADQRKQTLALMQDPGFRATIAMQMGNQDRDVSNAKIDEKLNDMELQLMKQMAIESGMMNNPLVQQAIQAKEDPESDPMVKARADKYLEAVGLKVKANDELGTLALKNSNELLILANQELTASIDALNKNISGAVGRDKVVEGRGEPMVNVGLGVPAPAVPNARGGIVYASAGRLIDFKPRGTDTVPAMLTPGEFVINARATAQHLPLLQAINGGDANIVNSGGMSRGGLVYLAEGGTVQSQTRPRVTEDMWNGRARKARDRKRKLEIQKKEADEARIKELEDLDVDSLSSSERDLLFDRQMEKMFTEGRAKDADRQNNPQYRDQIDTEMTLKVRSDAETKKKAEDARLSEAESLQKAWEFGRSGAADASGGYVFRSSDNQYSFDGNIIDVTESANGKRSVRIINGDGKIVTVDADKLNVASRAIVGGFQEAQTDRLLAEKKARLEQQTREELEKRRTVAAAETGVANNIDNISIQPTLMPEIPDFSTTPQQDAKSQSAVKKAMAEMRQNQTQFDANTETSDNPRPPLIVVDPITLKPVETKYDPIQLAAELKKAKEELDFQTLMPLPNPDAIGPDGKKLSPVPPDQTPYAQAQKRYNELSALYMQVADQIAIVSETKVPGGRRRGSGMRRTQREEDSTRRDSFKEQIRDYLDTNELALTPSKYHSENFNKQEAQNFAITDLAETYYQAQRSGDFQQNNRDLFIAKNFNASTAASIGAGKSIVPSLIGLQIGTAVGAAASEIPVVGWIAGPALGIATGVGSAIAASHLQEMALDVTVPEANTLMQNITEQHQIATGLGAVVGGGLPGVVKHGTSVFAGSLGTRLVSGGVGGTLDSVLQYLTTGKVDIAQLGMSIGAGAAMPGGASPGIKSESPQTRSSIWSNLLKIFNKSNKSGGALTPDRLLAEQIAAVGSSAEVMPPKTVPPPPKPLAVSESTPTTPKASVETKPPVKPKTFGDRLRDFDDWLTQKLTGKDRKAYALEQAKAENIRQQKIAHNQEEWARWILGEKDGTPRQILEYFKELRFKSEMRKLLKEYNKLMTSTTTPIENNLLDSLDIGSPIEVPNIESGTPTQRSGSWLSRNVPTATLARDRILQARDKLFSLFGRNNSSDASPITEATLEKEFQAMGLLSSDDVVSNPTQTPMSAEGVLDSSDILEAARTHLLEQLATDIIPPPVPPEVTPSVQQLSNESVARLAENKPITTAPPSQTEGIWDTPSVMEAARDYLLEQLATEDEPVFFRDTSDNMPVQDIEPPRRSIFSRMFDVFKPSGTADQPLDTAARSQEEIRLRESQTVGTDAVVNDSPRSGSLFNNASDDEPVFFRNGLEELLATVYEPVSESAPRRSILSRLFDMFRSSGNRTTYKSSGGIIYANNGALTGAVSQGTDTVPAMLTPGEFVVNRESAQRYTPILHAINSGHFNRGGIVNYLANGGIVAPKYYNNAGPVKGSGGSGVASSGGVFTNVAEMMGQAEKAIGQMVANTMNIAAEQMKQVFNKNIGEPLMQTVIGAGDRARQALEPLIQLGKEGVEVRTYTEENKRVTVDGHLKTAINQDQAMSIAGLAIDTSRNDAFFRDLNRDKRYEGMMNIAGEAKPMGQV